MDCNSVQLIKKIIIPPGRPKSKVYDEDGRYVKAIEYRRAWGSSHKEYVNECVKRHNKKKKEQFERYMTISLILKELVNLNKVSIPNELKNLLDKV